jgi:hypothetical protein
MNPLALRQYRFLSKRYGRAIARTHITAWMVRIEEGIYT